VLALVVAASGSSGASTSHLVSSIRIGVEAPLTGSQSSVGRGILDGATLAAQQLNARGGISGHRITIVPIDDRATPGVGVAAAKAALQTGLQGIIGPYNSGVGELTLPLYIKAGLVPMRFTTADATAGLGFTLQPMTSQIAPVATTAITRWKKATSVALIYDRTQTYTRDANATMESDLQNANVTVSADVPIVPGLGDYATAVAAAEATSPQLIYIVTYYPEASRIARDINQSAAAPACLADFGAYDNHYATIGGIPAAQACPVVGVPAPGDFAGSARLVAQYTAAFHRAPGVWSPYAYDSLNTLALAAERAGGFDTSRLTAALAKVKVRGWTGLIAFEPRTGNRLPSSVTVDYVNAQGMFHLDAAWLAAVGGTH